MAKTGFSELNATQKAAIKSHIDADPTLGPLAAAKEWWPISEAMNAAAAPAQLAWRINVTPQEADAATPWVRFDNIASAGKRDSYIHAFLRYNRDFSVNAVRKWVTDVWGNATAGSDAEAILLGCAVEDARRIEVVVGGTVKATNNVSALDRAFVGTCTLQDIAALYE